MKHFVDKNSSQIDSKAENKSIIISIFYLNNNTIIYKSSKFISFFEPIDSINIYLMIEYRERRKTVQFI